ncbi:MAG: SDR family NAD(P)-dependent oxidoreductase [Firmicutes bacterium]|nr:SDR family NAD(P)-dependent oxidoreductase [Bacillota bacterium]
MGNVVEKASGAGQVVRKLGCGSRKVAVIVGASSGIGEAIAKVFVARGYLVYNLSRRASVICGVENIEVDVANAESVRVAFSEISGAVPWIDYLIYSAGFSMASGLETLDEADYKYLFEVNYFGAIKVFKTFLPLLKTGSGGARVVFISSAGALIPIPFDGYYSASKASINMLAKALHVEFKQRGLKFISIMPGGVNTGFTKKRKVNKKTTQQPNAKGFENAVKTLADQEQNGMDTDLCAKKIIKVIGKRNPPLTSVIGLSNKLQAFALNFIPKKLQLKIIANKFGVDK